MKAVGELKVCSRCRESKGHGAFHKGSGPDGLHGWCKACRVEVDTARRATPEGKAKAAARRATPEAQKWRKAYNARPDVMAKSRAATAAWRAANPEKVKAMDARRSTASSCKAEGCSNPCDPRASLCMGCANSLRPGATSWTTLARDPGRAWSPSNLYLVEVELERGPVLKVGIGTLARPRNHKGDILYRIPCPRVVAYYWEQRVLEEAGRDPVDPDKWVGATGRTEVVAGKEKALAIFRALAEDPWSLAEPNDEIMEWFHDHLQGEHLRQLEETR